MDFGELVELSKGYIERILAVPGQCVPSAACFVGQRGLGQFNIINMPEWGDRLRRPLMRAELLRRLRYEEPDGYAFLSEAWSTKVMNREAAAALPANFEDLPPGQREDVAIVVAVPRNGEPTVYRAVLAPAPDGGRTVGPWTVLNEGAQLMHVSFPARW